MTKKRTAPDRAPRKAPPRKKFRKKGLILLYCGNGKGKTTAALGTALRAAGRGWKTGVVQFIKGAWKTGEAEAAAGLLKRHLKFFVMGEGFTWDTRHFEKDVETARKAWHQCVKILHDPAYELVIWDEILYALKYNFLKTAEVVRELKKKPDNKHVILTGNFLPPALARIADLVTEMRCRKHPYEQGLLAQPGIDY